MVVSTALGAFALANLSGTVQGGPVRDRFVGTEYMIPMRDGKKLHTVVWVPKNLKESAPILMERTPYGAGSVATGMRRTTPELIEAGYIFAYQDVRGKGASEGDYVNVRPPKKRGETFDESTDTYDTIEFLLKEVKGNNGRVGLWGISYPGFYAGASAINTHPALRAVAPQAPVSDWFLGDDVHHNGALFLQETVDFCSGFDVPRGGTRPVVDRAGKSAYDFYLSLGPLRNIDRLWFKGLIPYWNEEIMPNDTYNQYWKERSLPRNFKNVRCAVMTVGGFFDKEDLWGALNLYKYSERQNRGIQNCLVMGPWNHGGFARGQGSSLGDIGFGTNTSEYYRKNIELPFFEKHLKGKAVAEIPEASIFETGANKWHAFKVWPPKNLIPFSAYLQSGKRIGWQPDAPGSDRYISDPMNPVPYLADYKTSTRAPSDWLILDQRFAESRPDVLTYRTGPLEGDVQIVGPVTVDFWIKTEASDTDLVVKVIDEYPATSAEPMARNPEKTMAGYQMMVRSDIMRVKFRDSFEKPKPIPAGVPTRVRFDLNDTMHTFKKGHRLVIQVQGSWFPIADRNPNQFMNIHEAEASDFRKAEVELLRGGKTPSRVIFRMFDPGRKQK